MSESNSLLAIFCSFFKIGAMLFGGGYAMLPLLEREVVVRRKWCVQQEMMDFYAVAQFIPGAIAINTALLIGQRLRGVRGTLAALAGMICVPFMVILAYAMVFEHLAENRWLISAMAGVRPAVAGLLAGVAFNMLKRNRSWLNMGVALSVTTLMLLSSLSVTDLLLGGVAIGMLKFLLVQRQLHALQSDKNKDNRISP